MSAGVGAASGLGVGAEFRLAPRLMTRERMRWYVDIQDTVQFDDGRIHAQPPTIHDDDAYAKKQGLPGIIADGMISTNWILGILVDVFGDDALSAGRLRTKYIAPIHEDQVVLTCARVTSAHVDAAGATVYALDVWCEDDTGKKLTVGEAVVHATAR
jgi:3-hydroxybutyryl-CoA dehydratase